MSDEPLSTETIIFTVPMPDGTSVTERYKNSDEFVNWFDKECDKWRQFNNQRCAILWEIAAGFINQTDKARKTEGTNRANVINAAIEAYYNAKIKAHDDKIFYPSWCSIGKTILSHSAVGQTILSKVAFNEEWLIAYIGGLYPSYNERIVDDSIKRYRGFLDGALTRKGIPLPKLNDFYDEIHSFEHEHDRVMLEARKRKEEIEALFFTHMQLESPVRYWKNKATNHEKIRNHWFKVTIWSSLGLSLLLIGYLKIGQCKWLFPNIDKNILSEWPFVCGFLLLASFVYWFIRFSARQYSSQNYLYHDAKERETMAMTFLALTADDRTKEHVTPKEHMGIVLAALFRPSAFGCSDEGGPKPFYETAPDAISKFRE